MFNWLKKLFRNYERPANTGVAPGDQQRPQDYIAGATSPIPYLVRLKDGNWTPYTWSKFKQWSVKNGTYYDTLACTTFALLNSIEAQEFFLTGKQVRYSRRWVAKCSGTNQGALKGTGNYMYAPADWIRQNGLVLESSYPTPDSYTTDEFYADIPADKQAKLLAEGQEWKKKRNFAYEFLQVSDPNLDYHLKHAPITVVIPGHDICGIYSPSDLMAYRDSYEPWDKQTAVAGLQAALKGILTLTSIQAKVFGFQGSPELWISLPMDSMQRLDYVKQNLSNWLPDYYLNENITILPCKKP